MILSTSIQLRSSQAGKPREGSSGNRRGFMAQRWILGVGTGHCGLELLPEIVGKQPGTRFTLMEGPRLRWDRLPGDPGLLERIARWRGTTTEPVVGDVASYYLPYVEEALRKEPALKVVCLELPANEVLAGYCTKLNNSHRAAVDHWMRVPRLGFEYDPRMSHTFPHYDEPTREAGIRRYCQEYAERARDLASKFPDRFRIIDTHSLKTETGVRELLTFCGYVPKEHVLVLARPPEMEFVGDCGSPPHPFAPQDPRRCIVLVPYAGYIHQECDQSLKELERRGYQVRRESGHSAIDQGRNQMATDALFEGFEETMWIDSDVGFNPDDIELLRQHQRPLVSGIYPQKGKRALASQLLPGTPSITFGKDGGLVDLLYAATGFLLVRREVYLAIQSKLSLPVCNERFARPTIPFFEPMVRPIEDAYWYLAEDYAFSHRAKECGFSVFADTRIRLWHVGNYRYGWEEAGFEPRRFESFTLNFRSDVHGTPITVPNATISGSFSVGTAEAIPHPD